jgi:hypothetical protein
MVGHGTDQLLEERLMDSELSFLLDLLLSYKLPKAVQNLIRMRIKAVEQCQPAKIIQPTPQPQRPAKSPTAQSPHTEALLAHHGLLNPVTNAINQGVIDTPHQQAEQVTPEAIVASPQAAQAMQDRQRLINQSINASSGVYEKGSTTPVKLGGQRPG